MATACCRHVVRLTLAARPLSTAPLPPLRHRVFDWLKDDVLPRWRRRTVIWTTVGLATLGSAGYVAWSSSSAPAMTDGMLKVFEDGGKPGWDTTKTMHKVDRPKLVAELKELLRPEESSKYVVVVGESGTGKTTAVRETVRTLEYPRGAVYFSAPSTPQSFSTGLARVVGFETEVFDLIGALRRYFSQTTKEESSPRVKEEPLATWIPLNATLTEVATKYHAKHNRPMVLVIDAADLVAKKDPKFLIDLQDFAKSSADSNVLRVVFVTSEGTTLPQMAASSAMNRAIVFEVRDLEDDAVAIDYLVKRGVPKERAVDAVKTITGGRLVLLDEFASTFTNFPSNDDYREVKFAKVEKVLSQGDIPEDHALFKHLTENKKIKIADAEKLFKKNPTKSDVTVEQLKIGNPYIEYLLSQNVLAAHPDESLTFHSRHVQTFFERVFAAKK